MSEKTIQLTFTETIEQDAEAVFYALTNAGMLRQWLCTSSQVSLRENGRIYLYWQEGYHAAGVFTAVEENKHVAFTWQGRDQPFITNVSISLEEADGETAVSLTHSDIPSGDEWQAVRDEFSAGWESSLRNLKSILETGLDRRIYDQPFLGILIGNVLNEEQAKEQGLPIAGGIVINGTMDGTGAAEIGFEQGDVLVQLGGGETESFNALRDALRPYKAGEKVKVTYFRNGEKQSDMMLLSERPAPQVPESPQEAANLLRASFEQVGQALTDLLAGAPETAVNYRPAEGEWNAKDVLAHLIYTERFNQNALTARLGDSVLDGLPNNPPAWITAMSAAYKTGDEMLTAWFNTTKESVALIENLPESYVNNKALYLNGLNGWINFLPGHTQTHVEQIKTLLEAEKEPA